MSGRGPYEPHAGLKFESGVAVVLDFCAEREGKRLVELDLVLQKGAEEMVAAMSGAEDGLVAVDIALLRDTIAGAGHDIVARPGMKVILEIEIAGAQRIKSLIVTAEVIVVHLHRGFRAIGKDVIPAPENIAGTHLHRVGKRVHAGKTVVEEGADGLVFRRTEQVALYGQFVFGGKGPVGAEPALDVMAGVKGRAAGNTRGVFVHGVPAVGAVGAMRAGASAVLQNGLGAVLGAGDGT